MILDSKEEVIVYLNQEGLIKGDDKALVEHLSGGVSCRVWKITVNENRWVIKQALEKLDVKIDHEIANLATAVKTGFDHVEEQLTDINTSLAESQNNNICYLLYHHELRELLLSLEFFFYL